ncbi:MAG: hypothetical protein ACREDT_04095 [Methylocella sp.]
MSYRWGAAAAGVTNRQLRICARNKYRARSATARAALDFRGAPSHSTGVNALHFDTLRLSRILRDKGHFTSEQAEALAEALGEASHGDLATKADLAALRSDIAETKTELKTEIAELRVEIAVTKTELLKWIIGAIGFQTVVILGALISLIRLAAK